MLQQNPNIKAGIDAYKSVRSQTDLDLVAEVRKSMISMGILPKVISFFDTHPFIVEASTKVPEVQRYFLNRYFTTQLMMSKKPSIEARCCLIPNGEIKDWLNLFNGIVLPFMLENDLPGAV